MTKAEKMFLESGYRKIFESYNKIIYKSVLSETKIVFHNNHRYVGIEKGKIYAVINTGEVMISLNILKAIEEQIKELGWDKGDDKEWI